MTNLGDLINIMIENHSLGPNQNLTYIETWHQLNEFFKVENNHILNIIQPLIDIYNAYYNNTIINPENIRVVSDCNGKILLTLQHCIDAYNLSKELTS